MSDLPTRLSSYRRRRAPRGGAMPGVRRATAWAGAIAIALLTGCGPLARTPQARLHALDPVPPAAGAAAPCAVRFALRELRLAAYLDRPEVIVARDGSRILAEPDDLWAAPLAQQLRAALTGALLARLQGSQPVSHPWRLGEAPQLALAVEVDRLEPVAGVLRASLGWRASDVAASRQLAWGRWDHAVPIRAASDEGSGAAATVAAIDASLSAFADVLAARIVQDPAIAGWCRTAR